MVESEPTNSSTPSKKERTLMSKRIKALALLCFLYDGDIRNFAGELRACQRRESDWKCAFCHSQPPPPPLPYRTMYNGIKVKRMRRMMCLLRTI